MDTELEEIRAALARVLASSGFLAAPNLAAFLRYTVEETLAGRGDRLKAYTIAVTALERAESFDPNDNPLVRVQARRLRAALARYYETEGVDDPLIIDLPLGTYVPRFLPRALAAVDEETPPEEPAGADEPALPASLPARRRDRRSLLAALALALVLVSALGHWAWFSGWGTGEGARNPGLVLRDAEPGQGLDSVRVLPLLSIDVDTRGFAPDGFDAEAYRRRLEAFAERFEDSIVVTRRSPDYPTPPGQPLYRLHLAFARENDDANVLYQLIHAGDERVVRTGAFRFTSAMNAPWRSGDTGEIPRDLDVLRRLIQYNGNIWIDTSRLAGLGDALACMLTVDLLDLDPSPTLHRTARVCIEKTVDANPRLPGAFARLAEINLVEHRRNIVPPRPDPLRQAETALRRAASLAPQSALPWRRLQETLLLKGSLDAAVAAGRHALAVNPEDMNAVADHGALLARLGRYQDAVDHLRRAETGLALPPTWISDYAFLALNNLERFAEAEQLGADLHTDRNPLHFAVQILRGHRRGDLAVAADAFATLFAIDPTFRDDPLAAWSRQGLTRPVADHLIADLRRAGLSLARF